MSDRSLDQIGQRVERLAAGLVYPPTPDLTARLRVRPQPVGRRVLAAAAVLAILMALALVPQVRAVLVDWLQLGAVRIFLITPTQAVPPGPGPTPTLLPSLLDLDGRTTLAEARRITGLAVPLPAYPPDLGAPSYVFVQQFDSPLVILVWTDPQQPGRVRLSLHIITSRSYTLSKIQPTVIETTQVGGAPAVWAEGPYLLALKGQNYDVRRLIDGHVLIWQVGDLTYRLESGGSLDEAIRMAESLK